MHRIRSDWRLEDKYSRLCRRIDRDRTGLRLCLVKGGVRMKTCKHCGDEHNGDNDVCCRCQRMRPQIRRFTEVRDDVRELLGLERMGSNLGEPRSRNR